MGLILYWDYGQYCHGTRGLGSSLEVVVLLISMLGSVAANTIYHHDAVVMLGDCEGTAPHSSLYGSVTRYRADEYSSRLRPVHVSGDRPASREVCTATIYPTDGWPRINYRITEFSTSFPDDCLYLDSKSKKQEVYCGPYHHRLDRDSYTTWDYYELTVRYNISRESNMNFKLIYNAFKDSSDCGNDFECDNARCIPDIIKCEAKDPCGDSTSCKGHLSPFEIIGIIVGIIAVFTLCICCMKRTKNDDDSPDDNCADDSDQVFQEELLMQSVHQSHPVPENSNLSPHRDDAQAVNGYTSYLSREVAQTPPFSSHSPTGSRHTTGSGSNFGRSDVFEHYERPRSPGVSHLPHPPSQTGEASSDINVYSPTSTGTVEVIVHPPDRPLVVPTAPSVLGPNQHLNVFDAHAHTQSRDLEEFGPPPSYETVVADEKAYCVSRSHTDLNEIT